MNKYLPFALFFVIATSLMGSAIVAVLTLQQFSGAKPILMAAALGLVASLPVTWLISKKLS